MGFQRTKRSKGGSPSRMSTRRFYSSSAAARQTLGATLSTLHAVMLAGDPVAEIAVGERLQEPPALAVAFRQLVVVDQRVEAVALAAVPDVPDEGAVLEQLAVLLEEFIAQPIVEGDAAGFGEQLGKDTVVPIITIGGVQQLQQPLGRRTLTAHRGDADDTVFVLEMVQHLGLLDPFALLVGQFHLRIVFRRPTVGEQAGAGDVS